MNLTHLIRKGRMDPITKTDSYGVMMLIGWKRKDGSRKHGEFYLKKAQIWIDRMKIAEGKALTPGAQIIMDERTRRVKFAGENADFEDQYPDGQLAAAARHYITGPEARSLMPPVIAQRGVDAVQLPDGWPLAAAQWTPGERIRELQIAGALYLAEASRLKRAGKVDEAVQIEGLAMGCAKLIDDLYQVGPVSAGPWMSEPTAGGDN